MAKQYRRGSKSRTNSLQRNRRSPFGTFSIFAEAIRRNAIGDEEDEKRHRRFNTALAAAVVFFTFVQVLVSALQWTSMKDALQVTRKSNKLTRESNDISRRALEASERSWLLSSAIEPTEIASPDTEITVNVQNFENSPAFNVRVTTFARTYSLNEGFSEDVTLPELPSASQALVAQQQGLSSSVRLSFLNDLGIGLINTGDHVLEVRGTVTYLDRLLGERHTRYCRRWQRGVEGKPGKWLFCAGFNDAD